VHDRFLFFMNAVMWRTQPYIWRKVDAVPNEFEKAKYIQQRFCCSRQNKQLTTLGFCRTHHDHVSSYWKIGQCKNWLTYSPYTKKSTHSIYSIAKLVWPFILCQVPSNQGNFWLSNTVNIQYTWRASFDHENETTVVALLSSRAEMHLKYEISHFTPCAHSQSNIHHITCAETTADDEMDVDFAHLT